MKEKVDHVSLNDIRSGTSSINEEITFKKHFFGGYNTKDVSQNIKDLKESLQKAERSFKDRLEEHAAISTMLTQERDKYMKQLSEADHENFQLQYRLKALTEENDALKVKINELSENAIDQKDIQIYTETLSQNEEMKKALEDYQQCVNENILLKNSIDELEMSVKDLNERILNFSESEISKEEFDDIVSESERLNQECEQANYENTMLLADKNVLAEQNERLMGSLNQAYEKNKEGRDIIARERLKARKKMAETQVKIYEASQKHMQNVEEITEGIKNVLNILHYENLDITKLLNSPEGETAQAEDNIYESELEADTD